MKRIIAISSLCLLPLPATLAAGPTAGNDIRVVVDLSGSNAKTLPRIVGTIENYADALALRPAKRFDLPRDRLTVIAMDASPDVIFSGTVAAFRDFSKNMLGQVISQRVVFSKCTDVVAAVKMATEVKAMTDATSVFQHYLIFSDMQHEPPSTSIAECSPAQNVAQSFPWAALTDKASIVLGGLAPDQAHRWKMALAEHRIAAKVLTTEELASPIEPPAAAQPPKEAIERYKQERSQATQQYRDKFLGRAGSTLAWIAAVVAAIIAFAVLTGLALRMKQRKGA